MKLIICESESQRNQYIGTISLISLFTVSGGPEILEGVHPDLQLRAHLHSGGPLGRHRQTRPRGARNIRRQRRETGLTGLDRFIPVPGF